MEHCFSSAAGGLRWRQQKISENYLNYYTMIDELSEWRATGSL